MASIPTDYFKQVLTDRRGYLAERLQTFEKSLDQQRSAKSSERAIERENDEVLEGLGERGLAELRMIDAALHKIEDGSYGICANCGADIPLARLELVPHAAVCGSCGNG
ncbi:MAG: TraR/DksA family transcriptional regulator [Pseudomonadota bacterium]